LSSKTMDDKKEMVQHSQRLKERSVPNSVPG
jgi:hypothetical protein